MLQTIPPCGLRQCQFFLIVNEQMIGLLHRLAEPMMDIDVVDEKFRLFTGKKGNPLLDLTSLFSDAWQGCGPTGRFTSTMVRHTVVTQSRLIENECIAKVVEALARGMDHSVHMAEIRYQQDKDRAQSDQL